MRLVEKNADLPLAVNSQEMLKKANKEKRVIRHQDRVPLEIIKDTRYYVKGKKINPHPLVAEQLIENKIAKRID